MDYTTIALLTGAGVFVIVFSLALNRLYGEEIATAIHLVFALIVAVVGGLIGLVIVLICAPIFLPYRLLKMPRARGDKIRKQREENLKYRERFERKG